MDEDVLIKLQRLISEEFNVPVASITRSTTAADVDGWDSISHASLLMRIESAFGVVLPDDIMYELDDVGALHDQIAGLVR